MTYRRRLCRASILSGTILVLISACGDSSQTVVGAPGAIQPGAALPSPSTPASVAPIAIQTAPNSPTPSDLPAPPTPNPATPDGAPVNQESPGEFPPVESTTGVECQATRSSQPIRLLNQREYAATIRDVFDVEVSDAEIDPSGSAGIALAGAGTVGAARARELLVLAEGIVGEFMPRLQAEPSCATADVGCAESFLDNWGRRVFRRPLNAAERTRYLDFFQESLTNYEGDVALRMMISSMLVSPEFLYRAEQGEGTPLADGSVPLTSYEIATRLSYLLRGSAPDDELLAAAESGSLSQPDALAAQATRLLNEASTGGNLVPFFQQWLKVLSRRELSSVFNNDEEADAAVTDFGDSVGTWLQDPGGSFAKLFTHSVQTTDVDGKPLTLPIGILGDPAVLASHTSNPSMAPIFRGTFALESLVCIYVPPPDAMPGVPEVDPNLSVRETLAQHRNDPSCASCHQLIDPAGFPFQELDATGRFVPGADAVGGLPGVGEIVGVEAFAAHLASSPAAQECLARHWLAYAFARPAAEFDACAADPVAKALGSSPNAARALIERTLQLPEFLTLPKETL